MRSINTMIAFWKLSFLFFLFFSLGFGFLSSCCARLRSPIRFRRRKVFPHKPFLTRFSIIILTLLLLIFGHLKCEICLILPFLLQNTARWISFWYIFDILLIFVILLVFLENIVDCVGRSISFPQFARVVRLAQLEIKRGEGLVYLLLRWIYWSYCTAYVV